MPEGPSKLPVSALVEEASVARRYAYAPYSRFAVGAVILARSGKRYRGCNVENASFGATLCAERVALARAVAEGEQSFTAMAVVADAPEPVAPCGLCRQVLVEFGEDLTVIMANLQGKVVVASLRELLPGPFGPQQLRSRAE